ncbi:peroxidase 7-like [Magnolia sinica]|uniref:peroxidase 7-like n=1 Tax=Magnolia sinica TaxID=86752 RepID=UPI00265B1EBB|nr:peroxidase 7-like [Magnolia sinica]
MREKAKEVAVTDKSVCATGTSVDVGTGVGSDADGLETGGAAGSSSWVAWEVVAARDRVVMMMRFSFSFHTLLLLLLSATVMGAANHGEKKESSFPPKKLLTSPKKLLPLDLESLSFGYYAETCPALEEIVYRNVNGWIDKDYTLGASLIRLHFHDCAIRGCDASILLNHTGSERSAKVSKSLRGFNVIDDIKAEVEQKCPKTVSCADILTAAARDATVKIGGPFWEVPYGRKDGLVSIAKEADMVPMGHENITSLIEFFQSRGLNVLDLVVLSGSHTIGRSTCGSIQDRLYNFKGTGKPDPSIDAKYLNFLKRKCRWASEYADLDATTPKTFDSTYYNNLQKNMGLLSTDQLLYSDPQTAPIVSALATQPMLFYQQFGVSMVNVGNMQVLTGKDEGEIRVNCNFVNY